MAVQTENEKALAALIIEALNLEDVAPDDIEPEEPLFGDGLGLDSIDALELALAITQKYAIQLKAEDADTHKAFGTLRTLNSYIEENSG
jgi:acyl carrier protein